MKHLFSNLKVCQRFLEIARRNNDSDAEQLMLKLSLLEVCGWIEETLDLLYYDTIKNNINRVKIKKYIDDNISSFKYERFKAALVKCIGTNNFNILESTLVNERSFVLFKSSLNTLQSIRNPSAHTHYAGASQNYMEIKLLLKHLRTVYTGTITVRKYLRNNHII